MQFVLQFSRGGGNNLVPRARLGPVRGGTGPIFEYGWVAEGLKPWPGLGQKNSKIHTRLKATTTTLLPCLGQRKNERCPVLKPVLAIAIAQIHVIGFCLLGVQTKFILQIRQINLAGNALLTDWGAHTKLLYTLFRTERSKATPCPAVLSRIGHNYKGVQPEGVMKRGPTPKMSAGERLTAQEKYF